jgi:hypothetical protein
MLTAEPARLRHSGGAERMVQICKCADLQMCKCLPSNCWVAMPQLGIAFAESTTFKEWSTLSIKKGGMEIPPKRLMKKQKQKKRKRYCTVQRQQSIVFTLNHCHIHTANIYLW